MNGWVKWSTGNFARNVNLIIRTSGICTTQNPSWRMRHRTPMGFWHTNGSPNLSQTIIPYGDQQKKKRTCKTVDFAVPTDHRVKLKEIEKKARYLDFVRDLKTMEHKSDVYINCNCCFWYSNWRINKRTGGLGNKRTSGDHPNYHIIKINQNTEKSPGELRRLAVTQTLVKDHQLTLMWKNSERVNNSNNNIQRYPAKSEKLRKLWKTWKLKWQLEEKA